MNEGRWKWSLIESEASVLFCIGIWQPQPRCSEFPTEGSNVFPPPFSFSLFFLGLTPTVAQFNIYMFPSCLVSTAKGGGLSCVWFATAAIQFQLLKRWGPFEQSHLFEWAVLLSDKLDPSTSLMCPVGDGSSCVCVFGRETDRKREGTSFPLQTLLYTTEETM